MLISIRNAVHKLRRERWEDTKLSCGIEYRLIFDRGGALKKITLRHLPTYNKSSIADVMGSLSVNFKSGQWRQIAEYSLSKGEAFQKPADFFFDRERDRIFYSLDGATFSIPRLAVREIDDRLADFSG